MPVDEIALQVERQVNEVLASTSGRAVPVAWTLDPITVGASAGWPDAAAERVTRIWDGIRRLPYSDAQVACALGVCVG